MTLKVEVDSSDIPKAVQNIQRLERQYKMLEKALYSGTISVQQHSRAIQQVDNKILQLSRSMDTTTAAVQRSYKANRQFEVGIQQAGYQVGDFFVQVASGTSPMVAFTQQATQLVGFFGGPWGAVFGGALSVVGALGVAFLAASGNAKTFQEASQELESTISRLRDISNAYTIEGLEEQKKKYGELSAAVLYHIETLRKAEIQKAFEDTRQELILMYEELDDGFFNTYTKVGNLQSMLSITAQEAQSLGDAFVQGINAADYEGQNAALISIRDQILEIEKAHGPLKDEQFAFKRRILNSVDAMMQLRGATPPEGWLDAAIRGAQSLATAFWNAAAAKAAATGAANLDAAGNPIIPGLPGKKPRGAPTGAGGIDWGLPPSTGGGGGGGAARDPLEELRNRIALEKELLGVSESMATVLKALGKDRAKYSQAEIEAVAAEIEANKRKEEALKQQQNLYNIVQSSMENAFMATITGTESVADAFRSMAYEIVKELYKVLVVQQMVGSFNKTTGTGSGIVGFLGKLTGLESGGSMMQGRPYLVGERGPELVIPRHSGTVVNANQTASVLSGSAPITVQNTITVTGSDAAMVRAEVAKMIPQITNATKAAVIDARLRGGQMKAAFS